MVPPPARERFDAVRLINIANGLTATRVLLVPYFAYLLISGRGKAALLVFAVCGATDALDGLLARWLRQRTLAGTLLDPIADKLLMATAFIVLSYVHIVPLRLAIMVISRDIFILVGSFLYLLLFDSSDIRPTVLSKANTAVQVLTVIYFLAVAAFPAEARALGTGMRSLPDRIVTMICAATTVASGLQYLYLGIRKLSNA
ncbi:MAG: CDP-alcohol phosphatidyltransferase family protein [Deltaproteobacteria bacterium]|uniref:CDP-alcohol phosphatidyltransferase family protein n=1 Tax=Candidatus Deferrimicrobium sp. TaxID=3060586 RepID=UPI002715EB06|nr:CDP-alcohol phosphatidyltransferase family protein [Candidatus Deferrimicrobium sp.]MCR4310687.1 CDP-alcohol phosphatidyltransferase family protein [Deltaproteobacteria bacterium]MDO8737777.1 CDP-alcohol phosphatidyltransferase family protein [Candidatus Deferrimicrobium sp.]